jgi:hypothetical protein
VPSTDQQQRTPHRAQVAAYTAAIVVGVQHQRLALAGRGIGCGSEPSR